MSSPAVMLLLVMGIVLIAILVIIVVALVQRPTSAWRAQWKQNTEEVRRVGSRPLVGEPVQPRLVRFEDIWATEAETGSAYVAAPKIPTKEVVAERLSLRVGAPAVDYFPKEYLVEELPAPPVQYVDSPGRFAPVESVALKPIVDGDPGTVRPAAAPVDPDEWEEPSEVIDELVVEEAEPKKNPLVARVWGGITQWYQGLMDDVPVDHSEVPWQPDPNDVEVDLDSVITAGEFDPEAGLEDATGPGSPMEVLEKSDEAAGPMDLLTGMAGWWGKLKSTLVAKSEEPEQDTALDGGDVDDAAVDQIATDDAQTVETGVDDVEADDVEDARTDDLQVDEVQVDDVEVDDVEVDDIETDEVEVDDVRVIDVQRDDVEFEEDALYERSAEPIGPDVDGPEFGVAESAEVEATPSSVEEAATGLDHVEAEVDEVLAEADEAGTQIHDEQPEFHEPEAERLSVDVSDADIAHRVDSEAPERVDSVEEEVVADTDHVSVLGPVPIDDVPAPDGRSFFKKVGDHAEIESVDGGPDEVDLDAVDVEEASGGFFEVLKAKVGAVLAPKDPVDAPDKESHAQGAPADEKLSETANWLDELMAAEDPAPKAKYRSYLQRLSASEEVEEEA